MSIRDGNTGWIVIVQESYEGAIGRTLAHLRNTLFSRGLLAALLIAILSSALWASVLRVLSETTRSQIRPARSGGEPAP